MTPAARLQMAIDILEGLEKTGQPTDRFLKSWFRTRRFAGSKDRRAIAETVFGVQRRRASLAHRMGDEAPRALVIASLVEEGADIAALFVGGGYDQSQSCGLFYVGRVGASDANAYIGCRLQELP